jgi:hypothetical protein
MERSYAAGDWFAIPLRFGLFAIGRAAAVDNGGAIFGYFFALFFERLPSGADVLGLSPGDADLIGVCDEHGLRNGEWPLIAACARDPRPWSIPVFRTFDPLTGSLRWSTFEAGDLSTEIAFECEPSAAGTRNWGLSMLALRAAPMSRAAVESELWQRFRAFQTGMHRKYIADMQRSLTTRVS